MTTKVITIIDITDVPEGSVFDAVKETEAGIDYWTGMWSSRGGTYEISVPCSCCEEWDEQMHDPMKRIWRARYAEDAAQDKPGELPKLFIEQQLSILKREYEEQPRWAGDHELVQQRRARWIQSLEDYYERHYA